MAAQTILMASIPSGPFGWVIAGGAVLSGAVIVAGDADMAKPCCWEQVLNSGELDDEKAAFHQEHGILLPELAKHCDVFKDKEDEKLILRNQNGE